MSADEDGILARWSRRKLAARPDKAPAANDVEQERDEITAADDAAVSEPGLPETEAEELDAELVAALPRVEDLTAESDITAFLKKGVPMALKQAALRKVWSLDPAIRNYIGPSEYAWDFNQPGSMAGFGPLDAKQAVVGFLSKAARAIDSVAQPPEATPTFDPSEEKPGDAAPAGEEPAALPVEGSPTNEMPEAAAPTRMAGTGDSSPVEADPHPHLSAGSSPSRPAKPFARPRHGGAMPR